MNTRNWHTIWLTAILAMTFKAEAVELYGCKSAAPIASCETFCVQSVEILNEADQVKPINIIATNNLLVSADLKIVVRGTNISPVPAAIESTIPALSSCYVYEGDVQDLDTDSTIDFEYYFYPGPSNAFHNDFTYELPWTSGESHELLNNDDDYFEFAMPMGTPVYAARAGTIVGIKDEDSITDNNPEPNYTANEIFILHEDQTVGVYKNIAQNGALVNMGDAVEQGERIAVSGRTGNTLNPMLTFYVTTPPESDETGLIDIRFLTVDDRGREIELNYFEKFKEYTAVHSRIDPDLSFENDSELGDGSTPTNGNSDVNSSSGSDDSNSGSRTSPFTLGSEYESSGGGGGGGGGSPSPLIMLVLAALFLSKRKTA